MSIGVLERFRQWEALDGDPDLDEGAVSLVLYLAGKLYWDYEPGGLRPFLLRLEKWLDNVADENDQKLLVTLLSKVFFAGRGEFESLYRTTLGNISRWLVDQTGADVSDPALPTIIDGALDKTWICPITDSLRINSFLKVNEISGHDHRPHWRSLAKFGDVAKIASYISNEKIERLVLIEDFIGSGGQVKSTIEFATEKFPGVEVAVCPLIVCPAGDKLISDMASNIKNLAYLPTMVLPEDTFISPKPVKDEPPIFVKARELIGRVKSHLVTDPFGWKETGAMVVMFSNCPDNTIALFRDEAKTWSPLFPRVWRPE